MPDGDNLGDQKEQQQAKDTPSHDAKKEAYHHAASMWDQIHKSNSQDKREDLKEDVAGTGAEALNPFAPPAFSTIKPNTTEEIEENDDVGGENTPDDDIPVENTSENVSDLPKAPLNPFDDKAFGAKPLEEVRNVEEEDVQVEEEKSADEMGHANEGKDLSAENANAEVRVAEEGELVDVKPMDSSTSPTPLELEPELSAQEFDVGDTRSNFKDEFWQTLEQAGITKGVLFSILAVFVIAVGLLLFFLFGGFSGNGDDGVAPVVTEEPVTDGAPLTEQEAVGVISSYIFGLEFKPLQVQPIGQWGSDAGILAGLSIGQVEGLDADRFVENIQLLRKMDNAFNTDIYALINMATNRRGALQQHTADLADLIDQANQAVAVLDLEMDALSLEYATVVEERDLTEESFFGNLDLLQGEASYSDLGTFDQLSQAAVGIRSTFNAKSALRDMLVNALSFLEPRYRDIVVNEDALVQGVRVFDVPASDIDAIIPLDN